MDDNKKGLLILIKSAVTGEKYALPEGLNLIEVLKEATKRSFSSLAYYGAHNCGLNVKEQPFLTLFSYVCAELSLSEKQLFSLDELTRTFNEKGIDYMLLKGARIKGMYPKKDMRNMGDIDVLIREEQYPTIKAEMENLGYKFLLESDHEIIWMRDNVEIELHKRVIPSYNQDYYSYFGNGWKVAKKDGENSNSYSMSVEDEFIYVFTHLCKHYRDSGISVKHLLDVWVFKHAHPEMDGNKVEKEFEKLKILEFYKNIERTLDVWFNDGADDEKTDFITQVVFDDGDFSKANAKVLSSALKKVKQGKSIKQIKRERLKNVIFVPYKTLCAFYPCLKKLPILLPFIWLFHLLKRLFKKGSIKNYQDKMNSIKENEVELYKQSLNYVGLDYNFGDDTATEKE